MLVDRLQPRKCIALSSLLEIILRSMKGTSLEGIMTTNTCSRGGPGKTPKDGYTRTISSATSAPAPSGSGSMTATIEPLHGGFSSLSVNEGKYNSTSANPAQQHRAPPPASAARITNSAPHVPSPTTKQADTSANVGAKRVPTSSMQRSDAAPRHEGKSGTPKPNMTSPTNELFINTAPSVPIGTPQPQPPIHHPGHPELQAHKQAAEQASSKRASSTQVSEQAAVEEPTAAAGPAAAVGPPTAEAERAQQADATQAAEQAAALERKKLATEMQAKLPGRLDTLLSLFKFAKPGERSRNEQPCPNGAKENPDGSFSPTGNCQYGKACRYYHGTKHESTRKTVDGKTFEMRSVRVPVPIADISTLLCHMNGADVDPGVRKTLEQSLEGFFLVSLRALAQWFLHHKLQRADGVTEFFKFVLMMQCLVQTEAISPVDFEKRHLLKWCEWLPEMLTVWTATVARELDWFNFDNIANLMASVDCKVNPFDFLAQLGIQLGVMKLRHLAQLLVAVNVQMTTCKKHQACADSLVRKLLDHNLRAEVKGDTDVAAFLKKHIKESQNSNECPHTSCTNGADGAPLDIKQYVKEPTSTTTSIPTVPAVSRAEKDHQLYQQLLAKIKQLEDTLTQTATHKETELEKAKRLFEDLSAKLKEAEETKRGVQAPTRREKRAKCDEQAKTSTKQDPSEHLTRAALQVFLLAKQKEVQPPPAVVRFLNKKLQKELGALKNIAGHQQLLKLKADVAAAQAVLDKFSQNEKLSAIPLPVPVQESVVAVNPDQVDDCDEMFGYVPKEKLAEIDQQIAAREQAARELALATATRMQSKSAKQAVPAQAVQTPGGQRAKLERALAEKVDALNRMEQGLGQNATLGTIKSRRSVQAALKEDMSLERLIELYEQWLTELATSGKLQTESAESAEVTLQQRKATALQQLRVCEKWMAQRNEPISLVAAGLRPLQCIVAEFCSFDLGNYLAEKARTEERLVAEKDEAERAAKKEREQFVRAKKADTEHSKHVQQHEVSSVHWGSRPEQCIQIDQPNPLFDTAPRAPFDANLDCIEVEPPVPVADLLKSIRQSIRPVERSKKPKAKVASVVPTSAMRHKPKAQTAYTHLQFVDPKHLQKQLFELLKDPFQSDDDLLVILDELRSFLNTEELKKVLDKLIEKLTPEKSKQLELLTGKCPSAAKTSGEGASAAKTSDGAKTSEATKPTCTKAKQINSPFWRQSSDDETSDDEDEGASDY